jgi:hypothetical protein
MANAPGYRLPPDVADFADRFQAELERAVGNRMRRVGVPPDMIGIRYWGVDAGAFVRYHPPQLGGNIRSGLDGRPGINVDAAVLDADAPKVGSLAAWRAGALKDRVDAVIAHEFTEVTAPPGGDSHAHAVGTAELTPLAITDRARQILREYREAEAD